MVVMGSEVEPPKSNECIKYGSLVALLVQNTTVVMWYRHVRTRNVNMFVAGTAVVIAELCKCLVALLALFYTERSIGKWVSFLYHNLVMNPVDNIKMLVPALIYTCQNNLHIIGLSNLDPATYQVSSQLKILTTALFSVFMLQKHLSSAQWLSLVVLMAGVAAVQIKPSTESTTAATPHLNMFKGMVAVITSCVMSGFAGVYFEKILKGSPQSVWLRNVQLGGLGTLFGLLTLVTNECDALKKHGFFYGYDWQVWLAILIQVCGGLMVAFVVKYADNILKGFATSLSIIASSILSVYIFNVQLSLQFAFGAAMVIFSIFVYGKFKPIASSTS